MTPIQFERQVRSAQERVGALHRRVQTATAGEAQAMLAEALEELSAAFAELDAAQEELRAQNEELAAAQASAVAERDRYAELFEFAPHGYVVTDALGVIQQTNRAARELFNVVGPRFLAGKPLAVFVAPDDRSTFRDALTGLQRGEANWSLTLRFQSRQGGSPVRVVDVTIVPFRDPDTREALLRWQFRDVTEQHRAVAEAKRLDAEVARQRQDADRLRDEFVAVLAHELRSPLTPMLNAAQVIQERAALADPEVARAGGVITRQTGRLNRLIGQMMDLARLAQGKLTLRPERVDLAAVAAAAADTVRGRAEGYGLRLSVEAPGGPVWVDGDPGRLDQVLSNLLDNAVKYTESGGSVTVGVARDGGRAVVRVADTGVGIPADVLPRVFDLFAQGGGAAGQSQGGLGVGLAVVKRLVELHGGTVEARSGGPGLGTEVVISLPLAADSGS